MNKFIIFANGDFSPPTEYRLPADATIICADGGARHALALGLMPHTIIGDLDSLPPEIVSELRAAGVEIIEHPVKKDETDLELALLLAMARGATDILLLGMLGGRLDQQLANLLLLTRAEWHGARLRLADGNQRAELLRGGGQVTLHGAPGDTLSVVPLENLGGLSLSGAEWPLSGAEIPRGSTRTISNTFVENTITAQLEMGVALVVTIKIQNVKT